MMSPQEQRLSVNVMQAIALVVIGVALCGMCICRADQSRGESVASRAEATSQPTPQLVVTTYLRDAIVEANHGTVAVLEIRNIGSQPVRVDTSGIYRRTAVSSAVGKADSTNAVRIGAKDDYVSIDITVTASQAARYGFWHNTETDLKHPFITIDDGKSVFVKVAIPASLLVQGKCNILVSLRRREDIVAIDDAKTIECAPGKNQSTTKTSTN